MTHEAHGAVGVILSHCRRIAAETLNPGDDVVNVFFCVVGRPQSQEVRPVSLCLHPALIGLM